MKQQRGSIVEMVSGSKLIRCDADVGLVGKMGSGDDWIVCWKKILQDRTSFAGQIGVGLGERVDLLNRLSVSVNLSCRQLTIIELLLEEERSFFKYTMAFFVEWVWKYGHVNLLDII